MKWTVLFLAMLSATAGNAQNLAQNPGFDDNADGWDLSMYSTWSDRVDHGDSPFSGALQITTRSQDSASQCIDVPADGQFATYVFSAWEELDPQDSIAPCADPTMSLRVETFTGPQCANAPGKSGTFYIGQRTSSIQSWQQITSKVDVPVSMRVEVVAECNSQDGIAIHYVDDVVVQRDEIFSSNLEAN